MVLILIVIVLQLLHVGDFCNLCRKARLLAQLFFIELYRLANGNANFKQIMLNLLDLK